MTDELMTELKMLRAATKDRSLCMCKRCQRGYESKHGTNGLCPVCTVVDLKAELAKCREATKDRTLITCTRCKRLYESKHIHDGCPSCTMLHILDNAAIDNEDICQVLGKALGYPPKATKAGGVGVGVHDATTITVEAAERIDRLNAVLAAYIHESKRPDCDPAMRFRAQLPGEVRYFATRDEAREAILALGISK